MKQDQANANTLAQLISLLPSDATHFRVLTDGKVRPNYEEVAEIKALADEDDFTIVSQDPCTVFPAKKEGKNWVTLEWKQPAKKEAKKEAKKTTKKEVKAEVVHQPSKAKTEAKKTIKEAKKRPVFINTGFIGAIRELLTSGKHSAASAAEVLLKQYPTKDIKSIKRICYNVSKRNKIKWKSSIINTGYLNRIDELLDLGEQTTRQIGEIVSVEYEKELVSAKNVVRARLQVRTAMGHKLKVPTETIESRAITYLPV